MLKKVLNCTTVPTTLMTSPEFEPRLLQMAPVMSELSGVNGGGGVSGWVMTSSRRIPHPSYNDNSIMLTKVNFGCSYAEKSSKIIMLLFKLVVKTAYYVNGN
jgi:hypothetical protein